MAWLGHDRYEAEFEAETTQLGVAVSELDPQAPVPTCPEWTVRDLITHVGTGHRWAAEIVEGLLQDPAPYVIVNAPQEPEAWGDWLAAGARRLVASIRDRGPDRTVWTWQAEMTAGFWLRKMLHDELVHRFDLELAGGRLGDVAPVARLEPASRPDPGRREDHRGPCAVHALATAQQVLTIPRGSRFRSAGSRRWPRRRTNWRSCLLGSRRSRHGYPTCDVDFRPTPPNHVVRPSVRRGDSRAMRTR